jgi:hypothetical protein
MARRLANGAFALLVGAPAILLAGCGGTYDATVSGIVTLDSKPLPRGNVSFTPTAGGPMAYGQINGDGAYVVRTGREEGLPAGSYQVTVLATEESAAAGKNGGPPPMGKAITPAWYCDPTTSGLTFEVEPGDNGIDLALTSTPPPGWKPPRGRR